MTAYLSFEWLKFSKRWMPRVIVVLLLGLTAVAFWGQASRAGALGNLLLPRGWLAALTFCTYFAPFFWPVLGGSWAGNEYGWGTMRTILTRRPHRITHVLAALVVLLAGVALAIVAMLVMGTVAGLLVAAFTHHAAFTAGVWNSAFLGLLLKGAVTAWYVSAFYLVLAYAAAVIFRSAAVGIGIGVGATLAQIVLTNIFYGLGGFWQTMAQHFPFAYTGSMITRAVGPGLVQGTGLASVSPNDPSAVQSLIALGIYLAIFLALMLGAVRLRDVTA